MVNDAAVESPIAHTHQATGCRSRGSLAAGIRTWLSCGPAPTTPAAAKSTAIPTGCDPGGQARRPGVGRRRRRSGLGRPRVPPPSWSPRASPIGSSVSGSALSFCFFLPSSCPGRRSSPCRPPTSSASGVGATPTGCRSASERGSPPPRSSPPEPPPLPPPPLPPPPEPPPLPSVREARARAPRASGALPCQANADRAAVRDVQAVDALAGVDPAAAAVFQYSAPVGVGRRHVDAARRSPACRPPCRRRPGSRWTRVQRRGRHLEQLGRRVAAAVGHAGGHGAAADAGEVHDDGHARRRPGRRRRWPEQGYGEPRRRGQRGRGDEAADGPRRRQGQRHFFTAR